MTATAHALVGGIIAASIQNPAIGLPLAAASHPLLDLIPHWDFGWGWRKKTKLKLFLQASFDFLLGLTLAFLLFGAKVDPVYLLAAVFFANVWDFMEVPYWFFGWKFHPFYAFYQVGHSIQGKAKSVYMGIFTQLATVALVYLTLKIF